MTKEDEIYKFSHEISTLALEFACKLEGSIVNNYLDISLNALLSGLIFLLDKTDNIHLYNDILSSIREYLKEVEDFQPACTH